MPKTIKRFQCDPGQPVEVYFTETVVMDGRTVEIGGLQKLVSGVSYEEFVAKLQAEVDADNPTPPHPKPDWAIATGLFFSSESYRFFRSTTANQTAWITLENLTKIMGYKPRPSRTAFLDF